MSEPAKSSVLIADFPGLVTNADPRDLPPGTAQAQVNIISVTPGLMQVRAGYLPVSFDTVATL